MSTVEVDDQPPYRGRTLTRRGDRSLGGAAWDEAHQYLLQPDGTVRTVLDVPPGFAGTARGLSVALAAALRHGLVRRGGTATVAGRPCTQWESREPLDAGAVELPTSTDRTVSCVGADGTLLQESWTLHGRVVRTRTAESVGPGPDLTGGGLLQGRRPLPAPTPASGQRVKDVPRATLLRALGIAEPPAPRSFTADRDAAVITLDPGGEVGTEGGVLTWTHGSRLVALRVERGLTHPLAPSTEGARVDVGGRPAFLAPEPYGLQLAFGRGHLVVTVAADLPEDELLVWAGALEL